VMGAALILLCDEKLPLVALQVTPAVSLVVAVTEYVCLVTSATRCAESETVITTGGVPPEPLDPHPHTVKLKARALNAAAVTHFIPKLLFQNGMLIFPILILSDLTTFVRCFASRRKICGRYTRHSSPCRA
jgi:hypothetical protein